VYKRISARSSTGKRQKPLGLGSEEIGALLDVFVFFAGGCLEGSFDLLEVLVEFMAGTLKRYLVSEFSMRFQGQEEASEA